MQQERQVQRRQPAFYIWCMRFAPQAGKRARRSLSRECIGRTAGHAPGTEAGTGALEAGHTGRSTAHWWQAEAAGSTARCKSRKEGRR